MSGLVLRIADAPIPESDILEAHFDPRRGTFRYARSAKEPRRLRAIGGTQWLALADHQSRLYRFEWSGKSQRFDPSLTALPEATRGYCQIVPGESARAVFSVSVGPPEPGLIQFHWSVGRVRRWYTEGLGVWYGVGAEFGVQSLLFVRQPSG